MRVSSVDKNRLFAAALVPAAVLAVAALLTIGLPAQTPSKPGVKGERQAAPKSGKKPPKEEEEEEPAGAKKPAAKPLGGEEEEPTTSKKTGKKPPKEEEEEPGKNKPSRPLRVEDDTEDKTSVPRLTGLPDPDQTDNPVLRDLYRRLAVPHDEVIRADGSVARVAPVPQYVKGQPDKKIKFQRYDSKWKPAEQFAPPPSWVKGIRHFEQIALDEVDRFLKRELDKEPTDSKRYLSRVEMNQAAEKVLSAVVRFHDSARGTGLRDGAAWDELRKQLQDRLLAVQLDVLHGMAATATWDEAYIYADDLSKSYQTRDVRLRLVQELLPFVRRALEEKKYSEVQQRMNYLNGLAPNSPPLKEINGRLQKIAEEFFDKANRAARDKDRAAAQAFAADAERVWPDLPGLHEFRLDLENVYPVLYVGVRQLPQFLSPALAVTDSEKQACEMIFESLVRPFVDPASGQRYYPGLAADRPRLVPLGRQFRLDRDAFWSSGTRVTTADVRGTVDLLKNSGRADLLDKRLADDAFQINLTLAQGFLDPLALMTFKVLPVDAEHLGQLDDEKFARRPVGSGPFQLDVKRTNDREVVFIANPHYRPARRPRLPQLREIHFVHSQDPAGDFAGISRTPLHLLLDLPSDDVKAIRDIPNVKVLTLRPPRVWFLAVNHRGPELKNPNLRKAIAVSFNRNEILDRFFRGGLKNDPEPPHRPLNGPYPPGSWAADPEVKGDLYNPGLAKGLTANLRAHLTLKYPDDDNHVRQACEYIREQVQNATAGKVTIDLEPRSPWKLHEEVEVNHSFDLAYCHYDYLNEAYWLWPLFDPKTEACAARGPNYLGYDNDGMLAAAFHKAMDHREFKTVQEATHTIHQIVYDKLPLIPLWQLDTHIAIHKDVTPYRLDPLRVFTYVEEWKKKSGQ